ncbi:hypothetical protein RIF29_16192 [Crotalaria pallida]|uniref:Uncharacterized protein n=1 Tax=Crotalaria pallida TaxID=3830 RepID=A0AAN9FKJ8_CROPI
MEDVITEAAPPSRFLEEDLNNFTLPSPSLPSPFLLFSLPKPSLPLKPPTLLISLSLPSPSPPLPSSPLLSSLILPELPLSPAPRPLNDSISLHSLPNGTVFVSVNTPISPDRAHAVAKVLLGDSVLPDSVLVLDDIRPRNYRGRLSSDEAIAFKLETSAERKRAAGEKLLEGLEYYPSGSVADGLGAAILGRCQVLNIRASLCVSWPRFDASVVELIKGAMRNGALHGLDLDLVLNSSGEVLKPGRSSSKDHAYQSDLYI